MTRAICDHARGTIERCNHAAQCAIVFKGFSYFYCAQHSTDIETTLAARGDEYRRSTVDGVPLPKKKNATTTEVMKLGKKLGKLVRKTTIIENLWPIRITSGGKRDAVMDFMAECGSKHVRIYLDYYELRDLAQSCITHLDEVSANIAALAKEARLNK